MNQPHPETQAASNAPGEIDGGRETRDEFGTEEMRGAGTATATRNGDDAARGRSRGSAVTPAVEATAAGGKVRGRTAGAGAPSNAPDPLSATTAGTLERGPTTRGRVRSASSAPEMQAPGDGEARGRRSASGTSSQRGRSSSSALPAGQDDAASTSRRRGGQDGEAELRRELRAFAAQRRDGWNHDDWLGLLGDLRGRGFDVSDEDRVGSTLERERVALHLEGVDGLGARRVQALAERYGTIHNLRGAEVDDLARVQGMNRPLAQKLTERLRG